MRRKMFVKKKLFLKIQEVDKISNVEGWQLSSVLFSFFFPSLWNVRCNVWIWIFNTIENYAALYTGSLVHVKWISHLQLRPPEGKQTWFCVAFGLKLLGLS